jgi:hypothetical protein
MKKQLIIALACLASLAFTACSKKSEEATGQASAVASADDKPTTPEQQAQINALDKPVLDEKIQMSKMLMRQFPKQKLNDLLIF